MTCNTIDEMMKLKNYRHGDELRVTKRSVITAVSPVAEYWYLVPGDER
ncbi:MAG: hypothetical protein ACOYVF_03415 [Candidatus Zixiibacteriota bacterium]